MNPETEKVIDIMYESWLEYSDLTDKKCKHPSRKVYGQILKHAQLWNLAAQETIKQRSGGEDEPEQGN